MKKILPFLFSVVALLAQPVLPPPDNLGVTVTGNNTYVLTYPTATQLATANNFAVTGNTSTPTFNDVILGSSGPSVKSTLSARAPRQGLVQDGTSGSSVSVPAMGTTDFSFFTWINVNDFSGINGITSGSNGSFAFYVDNSNGKLVVDKRGIVNVGSSSNSISSGKFTCVGYTRSGTTGTFYINGIASGTVTDSQDYTLATQFYGSINPITQNPLRGTLSVPYFYNRALSSSEVVALYEAGAPAKIDYPSQAAGTAIIPASQATFTSSTGWNLSLLPGSTIDTGAGTLTTVAGSGARYDTTDIYKGNVYRYQLTVTSNTGQLQIYDGANYQNIGTSGATGTLTVELLQINNYGALVKSSTGGAVITDFTCTSIGLLLAPDAYQAGGGTSWYDTSGNSATITLPASGVSWNVPSSQKTASGWTFGGAINATGTNSAQLIVTNTGTVPTDSNLLVLNGNRTNNRAIRFADADTGGKTLDLINGAQGVAGQWGLYNDTDGGYRFISKASSFDITGNLTVSGTGTSSVAGKLQSIVPSATGYNQLYDTSGITTGRGAFAITSTGAGFAFGIESSVAGTSLAGSAAYSSYLGTSNATPFYLITNSVIGATLTSGGNLLLGTTTDGSNGKLQLATHTTSAGGIGFGTDLSVYRVSDATLAYKPATGKKLLYLFGDTNNAGVFDTADAGGTFSGIYFNSTAKSATIATNGSTALTLDSSQNATFANGYVSINGAPSAAWNTAAFNTFVVGSNAFGGTATGSNNLIVASNTYYDGSAFKYSTTGTATAYRQLVGQHEFYVAASGTAGNTATLSAALYLKNNQTIQLPGYGAGTLSTDASGNVTASSDARLKTNVRSFTRGLADVVKISPKTYNWTEASGLDTQNDYSGFIAQDVQAAIPEAVYEGKDAAKTLSLNDRAVIAALVNAVKELKAEVDALKAVR